MYKSYTSFVRFIPWNLGGLVMQWQSGFPGGTVRKSLPANAGGDPLEQKMATHSTILAWKIPWTEEPGGLPTPLFLPGKFHGQRSMVDYSPWGRKESDTAEWAHKRCLLSLPITKILTVFHRHSTHSHLSGFLKLICLPKIFSPYNYCKKCMYPSKFPWNCHSFLKP